MATTGSVASSNAPREKHVKLLSATLSGNEGRVRELLLDQGKWASAADHDTLRQALSKAATKGNAAILQLLLEAGADVHPRRDKDLSPLFKAAEAGHLDIAETLLDRKADPNWRQPKTGHTCLHLAALKGHTLIVKALLDAGAHPDGGQDKTGSHGANDDRTPLLLLASEKSSRWNVDIVRLLLAKGANPNIRDSTKRSPLHWAATNDRIDFARCLLEGELGTKADVNAAQNRGKTALHLASSLNRVDFVEVLLENGAHVDAVSDGRWTSLHNAAEKGHADVVARLLDRGANVNAELSNRMTALHWASFNGHEQVVKLILQRPDAKLNRKDQFERTPMICAAERYHNDIVQLLSPARHAHRLSEAAREASKRFEATVVDFGEFQEEKYLRDAVDKKKPQLVFKHTVYDLLYGWDEKTGRPTVPVLTKNIKWQPHFRWIHLPANNIAWIDTLLAKSFIEGGHRDVEGFKALAKCFDQEHRGPLAHANFMRHYCERITSRRGEKEESSLGSVTEWQDEPKPIGPESIATDLSENSTGKQEAKKKTKSEQLNERHPQKAKRFKGHPGNPPGSKEAKMTSRQSSFASTEAFRQLVNNGKMVLFMPFLHYETHDRRLRMTRTIERARKGERPPDNASRDELLIHAYMGQYLHPRRTLDQFFYHGIDTTQRDSDQVVWRYCKKYREREEPKLFMVDQLWMWILGGGTVITCFPERWHQPKQDPLNVVENIIEETNAKTRPQIQSVYDLALVITNRCAGLFDRHRLDEQQFQFLDMFESSIGNVTDSESRLFDKFNKASERATQWLRRHRHGSEGQYEDEFADDMLNIHQETKLLAEIKDIQDELQIIDVVLRFQMSVLSKLQANVEHDLRVEGSRKSAVDPVLKDIKLRFQEQMRLIAERDDDVLRMNEQARGISLSLTSLLDLKQKHSNALEARFAREQAIIAAKQGQTIMVFTIVTIIFLPMSFIAAFFAINLEDWGDGRLTIGYVSKYMFGIGLSISFLFISSAFLVHDISDAWKTIVRSVKEYVTCLGDKFTPGKVGRAQPSGASSWPPRGGGLEKPTTAGGASAAAHLAVPDDLGWKRRGLDSPDTFARISRDKERYEQHARLGMSPIRYGARRLSIGSGNGASSWARPSFDGRRSRFSGDLERGRDPSVSRMHWNSVP